MRIASLLRCSAVIAVGLLAVAATSPARARMGAFHICYQSKPIPGAVVMRLNLVVVTPRRTMSGQVFVNQAVFPPLHVTLPVRGHYRTIRRGRHVARLASPRMPGYHIAIAMTTTPRWTAAVARYSLWLDGPMPPRKGKVSLRKVPCK